MSQLKFVLLLVTITQYVHCYDIYKIKNEIFDMQEHAKLLEQDNIELSNELAVVKQKCGETVFQLEKEQESLHKANLQEAQTMMSLSQQVLEKQDEERRVNDALQRAFIQNRKYTLQVELYSQELDILLQRKKLGRAAKCQLLQPYFERFETDLSLRSTRLGRRTVSSKDELIVLQNELNQNKVAVQALLDKYKELKIELESYNKMCEARTAQLKDLLKKSREDLKDVLENMDLLRLEYNDTAHAVEELKKQLDNLLSSNDRLKSKVTSLKDMYASFAQDQACYKRLTNLNVMYQ